MYSWRAGTKQDEEGKQHIKTKYCEFPFKKYILCSLMTTCTAEWFLLFWICVYETLLLCAFKLNTQLAAHLFPRTISSSSHWVEHDLLVFWSWLKPSFRPVKPSSAMLLNYISNIWIGVDSLFQNRLDFWNPEISTFWSNHWVTGINPQTF